MYSHRLVSGRTSLPSEALYKSKFTTAVFGSERVSTSTSTGVENVSFRVEAVGADFAGHILVEATTTVEES